ncbi:hypothetical protein KBB76_02120 [Candidatus Saccharibacteria bacterium]|jgi:hypothetical protein|nr:hypothetical protein [Candidatus Saccharibacteria bacterium]HOR23567.1 hypothetical protein [Candidatus Saccharibacteria bacterium]
MKKVINKIKPKSGLSSFIHSLINALVPLLILVFVRLDLPILAAVAVVLAKWRVVAVKPRHWLSNVRANLVDVFVGLSTVVFIAGSDYIYTQLFWVIAYSLWLVWLKPKSKPVPVISQALIAQALALVAFYRAFPSSSLLAGVLIVWLVCYASAKHFLGAFDEPLTNVMSNIWAWFGAIMAWILGHWSIEYLFLPQIALILSVLGYSLATFYYLSSKGRLKPALKAQLIIVVVLILLVLIVFSDWQDKTI